MIKTKNKNFNYGCTLTNDIFHIDSDAPLEKGGKGLGFRPHELLEAAFASCLNISVQMKATELGIQLENIKSSVSINRDNPSETIFLYSINFDNNICDHHKMLLLESINNCAVRNTLSREIKFSLTDHLIS
jgi:putative redox protein